MATTQKLSKAGWLIGLLIACAGCNALLNGRVAQPAANTQTVRRPAYTAAVRRPTAGKTRPLQSKNTTRPVLKARAVAAKQPVKVVPKPTRPTSAKTRLAAERSQKQLH